MNFNADYSERKALLAQAVQALEAFYSDTESLKVSADWNPKEIRQYIARYQFDSPQASEQVLKDVLEGLKAYAVHTPHPLYFGLFNPRAGFSAALADFITAVYNPQMAAWSHAPYANEVENYLGQKFGEKMGYTPGKIDGTFCSGGAESNITALLCALNFHFPAYREEGLQGIKEKPIIYCSAEAHHSVLRAAMVAGLGKKAVVEIPTNAQLQMDTKVLEQQMEADLAQGKYPFMLAATAGTTGLGAIDNLGQCAAISQRYHLWFHVDAAYGGALVLAEEYRSLFAGIEQSHSITIDLHKWFSVPMAASLFLTSQPEILSQTFGLYTEYMPRRGTLNGVVDPYTHSIQWSRRFIGLKMYLPLAIYGWKGFEEMILHQMEMGDRLRELLEKEGWIIQNETPLPIVCFDHPDLTEEDILKMNQIITAEGQAW
ncbi:MAG: pyridoxal-dependent decarboxylase, partial [Bacteroidota bacterium]